MRIVFVDINATFLNPTRELVPRLLARVAPTVAFGPGWQPEEVLEQGLAAFVENYGPFDVVVTTEHIALSSLSAASLAKPMTRMPHKLAFPRRQLLLLPMIARELSTIDLPRVVFALETDFYNIDESRLLQLANFELIVAPGLDFVSPVGSTDFAPETHLTLPPTDAYYRFLGEHRSRVLSMPHFIARDDVSPFAERQHRLSRVAVPGVRYSRRSAARAELRRAGRLARGASPLRVLLGGMWKVGIPTYSSRLGQDLLRRTFRTEIRSAGAAFTDGSILNFPVRKFFEIPALGSLLLCTPCHGFEALGFKDRVNAITCEPGDLLDALYDLETVVDMTESITQAGQNLILERHTLEARASDFGRALISTLSGTYEGSTWVDGQCLFL